MSFTDKRSTYVFQNYSMYEARFYFQGKLFTFRKITSAMLVFKFK